MVGNETWWSPPMESTRVDLGGSELDHLSQLPAALHDDGGRALRFQLAYSKWPGAPMDETKWTFDVGPCLSRR
jgi:hypothetical protein